MNYKIPSEYVLHKSNSRGEQLEIYSIEQDQLNKIGSIFLGANNDFSIKSPTVTLDANAILVKTGESIWYYSWALPSDADFEYSSNSSQTIICKAPTDAFFVKHFSRKSFGCGAYKALPTPVNANFGTNNSTASVEALSADPLAALYNGLLRKVVDDLVLNFSKNQADPN